MGTRTARSRRAGRSTPSILTGIGERIPLITLSVLLVTVFLIGGGARDDITSLIVLRPIAVLCLGIGLATFRREHWDAFKFPLGFMAAILIMILLHLIPLPPALWQALPGRELAVAAGEAAGGVQPWRPLSLVPYRGWNAFYAMLVPAAAMVLAVQLKRDDHRMLLYIVIGAAIASALWGILQAISGYSRAFYFYSVSNNGAPTGLFANRNHMAALQVCVLPILALIASRTKGRRMRLVQTACAALALLAILVTGATGSRAGLGLILVALAGGWLIWRARPSLPTAKRPQRGERFNWAPYALGGFGVIMLGGFALLLTQSQSFERISGSGGVEEYRFLVWRTMIDFMPQYLPFGSGVGSFVEIFQVHEPSEMLGTNYWNHAHNDWLEWALEGGIPAIALMVVAILAFVRGALSLVSQSHTGQLEVQMGLTGAVVLFVLGVWSGVDYPLRAPALACLAALASVWMALASGRRSAGSRMGQGAEQSGFTTSGGTFETRPMGTQKRDRS
ncbi:MAG: O-antigen ligase family protein [Pseudomonadota bacterium]